MTTTKLRAATRLAEIERELDRLMARTASFLAEQSVEIGKRLREARAILKAEGRWVAWLRERGWTTRTAYNLIGAADAVDRDGRLLEIGSRSALYLLGNAPEAALARVLEMEHVGYGEAKAVVDAHKWAAKVEEQIEALKNAKPWEEPLARRTACEILAEIDAALERPEARELALGIEREHGSFLRETSGHVGDAVEDLAGRTTLRERHGEPWRGSSRAQLVEAADNCRIVVWVGDDVSEPVTVALFPRVSDPVAAAHRVSAIEGAVERTKARTFDDWR